MVKADSLPDVIAQTDRIVPPLIEVLEHSRCPAMLTAANLERSEILFVNEAFTAVTGYANSELVGMLPEYLLGALTDPDQVEKVRASLKKDGQFHGPILAYGKQGETILFDIYVSPVQGRDAQVECWLSILPVLDRGVSASFWQDHKGFAGFGDTALPARQVARAQALQRRLAQYRLDKPADIARAQEISAAIAVIDARMQVLFATHSASALFREGDGVRLDRDAIAVADKAARRQLAWLISRAMRRSGSATI